MTSAHFTPLTDLERDALGELSNIAMARAANSLRQMVNIRWCCRSPAWKSCQKKLPRSSLRNRTPRRWWRSARLHRRFFGTSAFDISRGEQP